MWSEASLSSKEQGTLFCETDEDELVKRKTRRRRQDLTGVRVEVVAYRTVVVFLGVIVINPDFHFKAIFNAL